MLFQALVRQYNPVPVSARVLQISGVIPKVLPWTMDGYFLCPQHFLLIQIRSQAVYPSLLYAVLDLLAYIHFSYHYPITPM